MFVEETVNINGIEGLSNIEGRRTSPRALFPQNGSPNAVWYVWVGTRTASAAVRPKLLRFESDQRESYSNLSKK